ncbi:MAG: two-component system response regulator CreB [Verrucomicrobia bacterium]|nr:two-component system response regulator CreB [Verrucomicrobiota bacterium]MDA1085426.1 two-component system response regulator CreB [Verrucomicrobiota bacterium]
MSQRILIVEDEPAIADTLTYALETDGFAVEWCTTAGDARARLAQAEPDAVILDIGLPDDNGLELCKDIRKVSNVPVVFLTARSDEVDRIVGLEVGADDYVVKPFSPREVSARIKAILRRVSSAAPAVKSKRMSGPIAMDPDKRQVTYFGTALDLPRYEYRILEVLLERPGRVYSREKLMDLVWEEPDASLDRTVDTHIKTLRARLRNVNAEIDPIQTHRGVGYSLRDDLSPG